MPATRRKVAVSSAPLVKSAGSAVEHVAASRLVVREVLVVASGDLFRKETRSARGEPMGLTGWNAFFRTLTFFLFFGFTLL